MKLAKLALLPLALFAGSLFAETTTETTSTTSKTTTSAQTPKKAIKDLTCEDFLVIEESFQPKVIYLVVGQNKDKRENVDMVIGGTEKLVPEIIEECKKNPKDSFVSKVKTHS